MARSKPLKRVSCAGAGDLPESKFQGKIVETVITLQPAGHHVIQAIKGSSGPSRIHRGVFARPGVSTLDGAKCRAGQSGLGNVFG